MPNSKNSNSAYPITTSHIIPESILELHVEYRPISGLRPNKHNPRTHSKKHINQIVESIDKFGFVNPIILDDQGNILAGHGRYFAAKLLGYKEVPVICINDMTEAQKKAYLIADNRLAELSGWDQNHLAFQVQQIFEIDPEFDITITGFETGELDLIIGDQFEHLESDTPLPPVSSGPSISRPGDLWISGHHRCYCGDATKIDAVNTLMSDNSAQMVFTDPPYNLAIGNIVGRGQTKHREFPMASGEMTKESFIFFLTVMLKNLLSFTADGSIFYICMDWRHIGDLLTVATSLNIETKNICVWDKGRGGMGSMYRSQHEFVAVFKIGTAPHVNNIELGRHGRNRTNVWQYPPARIGGETDLSLHPTAKPIAMVADAIKDCSHRGDIILDPFCGSGTTIIAAENTGRCAYVMELDPHYVDLIIRRWQALTSEQAILEKSGMTFDEVAASRQSRGSDREMNDDI